MTDMVMKNLFTRMSLLIHNSSVNGRMSYSLNTISALINSGRRKWIEAILTSLKLVVVAGAEDRVLLDYAK